MLACRREQPGILNAKRANRTISSFSFALPFLMVLIGNTPTHRMASSFFFRPSYIFAGIRDE
jgi:hypothetical protein